jgi:hypothetical protein
MTGAALALPLRFAPCYNPGAEQGESISYFVHTLDGLKIGKTCPAAGDLRAP